jgi:kynureninase
MPLPDHDTGSEARALALDAADALRHTRDWFDIPPASCVSGRSADTAPAVYFTGNSLGCRPKAVAAAMADELDDWARLGVEGHLHGRHPWLPAHEALREPAARLVGALPREVVVMNSLTVNLHLLMVSFYRPTRERFKIIIEETAFPSDSYAVASQARFHAASAGFDPGAAVVRLRPRDGEATLRTADALEAIDRHAQSLALVMLGGVNYLTGQWFDMPTITAAAKRAGAVAGWDLAHAAGNVPMKLHDWDADFAAWCSYKYLNSGPGALAGAFVHERHVGRDDLPQFAGWWGNDPASRFKMGPGFSPVHSADRWQLSNPPIFSMVPVRVSLNIFDQVGMPALREKSLRLTAYLEERIDALPKDAAGQPLVTILTPRNPAERGSALSLVFRAGAKAAMDALRQAGVVCDFREPDVIRAAPVPLYNTFHDCWRFAQVLAASLGTPSAHGSGAKC